MKKFVETFNIKLKDNPLQYELVYETYNTFIIINNTSADSLLTVKAGEAFPNSMLGNMIIEIPQGISAIQIP